ncbi:MULTISPECIES: hypothetical protein [unclassified Brevibacterium]|uniref:hypothetical protein n=1 Tax=unclassified Brevibacterium TaxID=2614124 RepID=UPI0010923044|nr:hypothetical protein [Brevibacterium sp. S22]TGD33058.1 hypothetical protein EB835_00660 [Brevibacterium sp. S22]
MIVAIFSALSLVSVVGCADTSPVAAPTSTLPANEPDADSTDDTAEVAIPDYETDLDLNKEEKKAVEGALVAFEGFIQTINEAYSGKTKATSEFPQFASGDALKSIQAEAKSVASDKATFEGQVVPLKVEVFDITELEDSAEAASVLVNFCVDTTKWTMTPAGQSPTSNPDGKVTMQHTIQQDDGSWKVDQQTLWERRC